MSDAISLPSDADKTGRDFGEEELTLLREVIESGTLNCTKGTQVNAFERDFAARYGMPHARAVTSGTAAIHTAISAIDPEPATRSSRPRSPTWAACRQSSTRARSRSSPTSTR